jgi:transmembrane sensor
MTGIDWDLLTRYHAGTCTASERHWVERLLVAHPEVGDALVGIRDVAGDGDATLPAEELRARLAAVKRAAPAAEVAAPSPAPRFTIASPYRRSVRLAAGVALAVAGGAGAWLVLRHPTASSLPARPAYSVVTTAPGQRLSLRLSDGTTVMLAPGSTLRTPATYGTRDRTVELEGEAVFAVAHDSSRPFAVHTAHAVATDIGTRFLVRAYRDDGATEIVVAEGEVAVRKAITAGTAMPVDSVVLGRAERVRVAPDGHLDHARGVALDDYFGWTEGRLVFRDVPLREVVRQLGRWYDIDVRLEPQAIGGQLLRATVADEAATDALELIAASLDLRLSRAGRVFTLSANH